MLLSLIYILTYNQEKFTFKHNFYNYRQRFDGINFQMNGILQSPYVNDFLEEFNKQRLNSNLLNIIISISPSCDFPDPVFGPGKDKALDTNTSKETVVDEVSIVVYFIVCISQKVKYAQKSLVAREQEF